MSLAIVKKIVESDAAGVRVAWNPVQGSTFIVTPQGDHEA